MYSKEKAEKQEKVIKERRKQKINMFLIGYFRWFIFLFVLLFLGAGYIFFLGPKYAQVQEVYSYISKEKKRDYLAQEEYSKELKDLIFIYNNISEKDLERMKMILPERNYQEGFFTNLEYLFLKQGFVLDYIRVAKNSKVKNQIKKVVIEEVDGASEDQIAKDIGVISISLSVSGVTYENMKKLLASIENSLRIMDISKLDFSPGEERVSLEIKTYYLIE